MCDYQERVRKLKFWDTNAFGRAHRLLHIREKRHGRDPMPNSVAKSMERCRKLMSRNSGLNSCGKIAVSMATILSDYTWKLMNLLQSSRQWRTKRSGVRSDFNVSAPSSRISVFLRNVSSF